MAAVCRLPSGLAVAALMVIFLYSAAVAGKALNRSVRAVMAYKIRLMQCLLIS